MYNPPLQYMHLYGHIYLTSDTLTQLWCLCVYVYIMMPEFQGFIQNFQFGVEVGVAVSCTVSSPLHIDINYVFLGVTEVLRGFI